MRHQVALALLLFHSAIGIRQSAFSEVPQLINYQGRLLNGTNLVNGNIGLSLRLFNGASGGTKIYEDSNTVTVADGLYSTFIGDHPTNAALLVALTNAAVWVEVAVNGSTLSPRERIGSTPYALNAYSLDGVSASQWLRSDVAATHAAGGFTVGTGSFLTVEGALNVFGASASDNDFIYFDNGTNEFLRWNNPSQRFDLSDDLAVGGTLAINALGLGPRAYNRIGASNTSHGLASSNDLLVTGHVEVDGALHADGPVQIASGNPAEGRILTSDATGGVRWVDNPLTLFGLDFSAFVPEVLDNTVVMEIPGITGLFTGLVINGPGYTIERIPGFNGFGQPDDESGLNAESPLIFETDQADTNALNLWYANFTNGILDYRSMSFTVRDTGGAEVYRYNCFELRPAAVGTGLAGRTRYTLLNRYPPNLLTHLERDPASFGIAASFNTNTDRRIEISGITHGPYPAVVRVPSNRTVELTFDYGEGGSVLDWVRDIAQNGTTGSGKRDLSVIYESFSGTNYVEFARTNFFGVFPIGYQAQRMAVDLKGREKVTLSYDYEEDGS
jgi:hypothetical protein